MTFRVINGTMDLTNVTFSWRTELKNTTDMFTVGNTDGAKHNMEYLEMNYEYRVESFHGCFSEALYG